MNRFLIFVLLLSGCGNKEFATEVGKVYSECKGTKSLEVYTGTFGRSLTVRCEEKPMTPPDAKEPR